MLSHWDTLSFDQLSRPISGISSPSSCGVQVEIHENLVHLRHQESWKPASGLPCPICAIVTDGFLVFQDVTVLATGGPRDGVYLACWWRNFAGGDLGVMVGIGCLGFDPGQPYRGILNDEVSHLARLLEEWKAANLLPENFPAIAWQNALRFCQGDEFIASRGGFPTPATPPGQALCPIVMQTPAHTPTGEGS